MIRTVAAGRLKRKYLRFSTSLGVVDCGAHAVHNFERTDPFSFSVWWRNPTTTFCMLAAKSSTDRGITIRFNAFDAGGVGIGIYSDFPSNDGIGCDTNTGGYNDGKWHHSVFTYAGTSLPNAIKIYIDGSAVTTKSEPGKLAIVGTIQVLQPLSWGIRIYQAGNDFQYEGDTADLALYNKELTAGEVTTIYGGGQQPNLQTVGPTGNLVGFWRPSITDQINFGPTTITDVSSQGNTATVTNGAGVTVVAKTR